MDIEVLKFGGIATSTKKNRNYISNIIKNKKCKIVLVVSAMGRVGFPYSSDTLLSLVDEDKMTKDERARLLSCGETIATVVVINQLKEENIKAYAPTLEEVELAKFFVNKQKIEQLFNRYDVLVIPGFIYLENHEINLYSRGGGDLSAVIISKCLELDHVTLYKDILGIQPFLFQGYKDVKHYDNLSYFEAIQLANIGYDVIQKEALEFAAVNDVEIIVKNFHLDIVGTRISKSSNNKQIIGVSTTRDSLIMAANNTLQIKKDIDKLFIDQHIYIKEVIQQENVLEYRFNINQIQAAKKIFIENFFKYFL